MDETHRESLEEAAIVAHQIKSPVGTLQTIVRTLLGGFAGELTDEQKKMLQAANRKCSEAMDTIKGLLVLAEVSSHTPRETATDVVDAARQARERYRHPAGDKNLRFALQLDAKEAYVRAEPTALAEAVAALVDNAVKYTPEGGRVALRVGSDA